MGLGPVGFFTTTESRKTDEGEDVTNYRLHLVYTVFYLFPILVIEFMHVPITAQPTLYIIALHISHIKYISL